MIFQRIANPNGIDDFKLTAETPEDALYIQSLNSAGVLGIKSSSSNSISFRAMSIALEDNINNALISLGKIGVVNFEVRKNQTFIQDLKFISTPAIDLSSYESIKLQIKNTKHSFPIISLNVPDGLEISGDDNDILKVLIPAEQTNLLCNNEYYYDVMLTNGNSNTYILEGKINVKHTITT